MLGDNFWLCIESLAASIDGSEAASEEALNQMESELNQLNRAERDEMRRRMILIVAQLARVEVRMMEVEGPLKAVV